MMLSEKRTWEELTTDIHAEDIWFVLHNAATGFTYHHNALNHYWAHLDRWYLLHAQQFTDFSIDIQIEHSLRYQIMLSYGLLLNLASLWMTCQGTPLG